MKKIISLVVILLFSVSFNTQAAIVACSAIKISGYADYQQVRMLFKNGVRYSEFRSELADHTYARVKQVVGVSTFDNCFDSLGQAKTFFAKVAWGAITKVGQLGYVTDTVQIKTPSKKAGPTAVLRVQEQMDYETAEVFYDYGLEFKQNGISGKIGFEDVNEGFRFIAWYYDGTVSTSGIIKSNEPNGKFKRTKAGSNMILKLSPSLVDGTVQAKF